MVREAILSGAEMEKPGWTRLNLSALCCDAKADLIVSAVDSLARAPSPIIGRYDCDPATARAKPPESGTRQPIPSDKGEQDGLG